MPQWRGSKSLRYVFYAKVRLRRLWRRLWRDAEVSYSPHGAAKGNGLLGPTFSLCPSHGVEERCMAPFIPPREAQLPRMPQAVEAWVKGAWRRCSAPTYVLDA